MSGPVPANELHDFVAAYAIGALEQDERHAFEDHLLTCAPCRAELRLLQEVTEELAVSTATDPPPSIRQRLTEQVRSAPRAPGIVYDRDGVLIARGAELPWATLVPGISYKQLYVDASRRYRTMLLRMDAGARLPEHEHGGVEEIFVLSGDLYFSGAAMGPGDYCRADHGSTHQDTFSKTGCLFLVIASQDNQFVAH